jgi:hypothetical protein
MIKVINFFNESSGMTLTSAYSVNPLNEKKSDTENSFIHKEDQKITLDKSNKEKSSVKESSASK